MQTEEFLPGIFEGAIDSFSQEGVVEKISVISMNGAVLATNDPIMKEFGESKQDIDTYQSLSLRSGQDRWFYSAINEKTKVIDIFIPLSIDSTPKYIVKLSFSISNMSKAMVDILIPVASTVIAVIIGCLFLGFLLLKTVVRPIEALNAATKELSSGNFEMKVAIKTNDEIQELGETFNEMTIALNKMRDRAENANPLTKLPGNNVIREEVEARIKHSVQFVAIHLDLNNFKVYNDRYGIAKGDEVIKFTSKILDNALKSCGNSKDFLGHEGGDDFFIITTPDKAVPITQKITNDFDSGIKGFYSQEDRDAGYIVVRDRRGGVDTIKIPLMTISMAGVTNQFRPLTSYGELSNIAVGVKIKAKQERKSVFIMDRRGVS
jgi:diguanylate cyclase (GGDEF)-like protein